MKIKGNYRRAEEITKAVISGEEVSHTIWEYNEHGQVVRMLTENKGTTPYSGESIYTRDEAGRVTRIDGIDTLAGSTEKSYSLYEYDEQGKLKTVRSFTNGEMTRCKKYTYDEKDNAEIILTYKGDELKTKRYKLYDSEHRLLMERGEENPINGSFDSSWVAIFDPESELVVAGCQTNPNYMYRNELVKDSEGNVVKMLRYSTSGGLTPDYETIYRYIME